MSYIYAGDPDYEELCRKYRKSKRLVVDGICYVAERHDRELVFKSIDVEPITQMDDLHDPQGYWIPELRDRFESGEYIGGSYYG